MANYRLLNSSRIDKLMVEFTQCRNPELIIPKLKGLLKAFTKDDLVLDDYIGLYDELVRIGHYKEHRNKITAWFQRRKNISELMHKNMDSLLRLANKVIEAYTHSLIAKQEIYLKLKVLVNVVRYEREFKKKLLSLFSENLYRKEKMTLHSGLDNSTLLSEQNADSTRTGSGIPVF
jgi:hypothetical protein